MENYDLLETIGNGAFGKVCKVRRKVDNKILVWKEMSYGSMNDKEKQQLVAEVNILREMRSPFIVRYYDRIVDKQCSTGGDLGRIIKKCKRERVNLEESLIWKVFAQIALALKQCHQRSENAVAKPVLHRDIKPANVFLDQDENLKLGDFGLAKELCNTNLAHTNVGTPFYMSPELINGKCYDNKSDIWALGCLVYELAALRPPFDAANQLSLAVKINAGKFNRIPNKYSEELQQAIAAMLSVDPKKRPSIENIETFPGLQNALQQANYIYKDYHLQSSYSSKMRDLKAKEDSLKQKESTLRSQEESLTQREMLLQQREVEVSKREKQLQGIAVPLTTIANSQPILGNFQPANESVNIDADKVDSGGCRRMSIESSSLDCDIGTDSFPSQPALSNVCGFEIYQDPTAVGHYIAGGAAPHGHQKQFVENDFSTGIARARELLNRPRIGDITKPFYVPNYVNYNNHNQNNMNNNHTIQKQLFKDTTSKENQYGGNGNVPPRKMASRAPPPVPVFKKTDIKQRQESMNAVNENELQIEFGSATKRHRTESKLFDDHNGIPSIQVDLQSLVSRKH